MRVIMAKESPKMRAAFRCRPGKRSQIIAVTAPSPKGEGF